MSHNTLRTASQSAEISWEEPSFAPSDWNQPSPSAPEVTIEAPERGRLRKRFGDKITSMMGRVGGEEAPETVKEGVDPVSAEERIASLEAVEQAKARLEAAQADLAERHHFFDSQQTARLPKPDGSGFTEPIRKSNLDSYQIEQAKYFDSQQQHFAVQEAQKALDEAQGARAEVSSRSWAASEVSAPQQLTDQKSEW